MVFGIFKQLLGGSDKAKVPPKAIAEKVPVAIDTAVSEAPRAEARVVVQRDEMIDPHSRIAGYRFVVKPLGNEVPLPAQLTVTALCDDNLHAVAQRRQALISIAPDDWFGADFAQFVGPNTTFFMATPPAAGRERWVQAVSAIKAAGGGVAVDGAALDDCPVASDVLLLDFTAYPLETFEYLVKDALARYPGQAIVVDGVASWDEQRLCHALGARHALGEFVATPDVQGQRDPLSQSRMVLVEMLNLLRRDGSPEEIAAVAKRDPGVAVKILEMANSPMSGLSAPVASVEKAMLVLGRETLYRWLLLAMFRAGAADSRDETLLELALFRGRFIELMAAGHRSKTESDELFLVGLLSLVDSLLGLPMSEVVGKMHLPQSVADVLLGNGGPYSRWLMLALAVERGRIEQATELLEAMSLDAERLGECVTAARMWAEEALQNS